MKTTGALPVLAMLCALAAPAGGEECRPTETSVEGPYYVQGSPFREEVVLPDAAGERLDIEGTVYAADCRTPLTGAVVELWQAGPEGTYDSSDRYLWRGRAKTDGEGRYFFRTVLPGRYGSGGSRRPAHLHLKVSHPEGRTLITQVYFEGDSSLATDPFVKRSLVISLDRFKEKGRNAIAAPSTSFSTDPEALSGTGKMSDRNGEDYVHGYNDRESERLRDQADTLTELLHGDTAYPDGDTILEAGCGVGAQTVTLASRSPGAKITSVDLSGESLAEAVRTVRARGITNVLFRQADIFRLPFSDGAFDHVFLCFVLEHLADPLAALVSLKKVLKPGGTITVVEGDHGSAYFHPDSPFARKAIQCLVDLQARGGGNALIGRELYPLLGRAGFRQTVVSPRVVYADHGRPGMVEGFTKKTFTAMVEGVREEALASGMVSEEEWDRGIADLYRTAGEEGTFSYTFFKAVASKGGEQGGGAQ